jgi:hypothetical protein
MPLGALERHDIGVRRPWALPASPTASWGHIVLHLGSRRPYADKTASRHREPRAAASATYQETASQ